MKRLKNYKVLNVSRKKIGEMFPCAERNRIYVKWEIIYDKDGMYLTARYNILAIIGTILLIPLNLLMFGISGIGEMKEDVSQIFRDYLSYVEFDSISEYDDDYNYLLSLQEKENLE